MVWLPAAEMSKAVPGAESVTAPVAAGLPPAPIASVPALIRVPPVKVLVPVSVSVPVPSLIRPPVPAMEPLKTPLVGPPTVIEFAPG